MKLTLGTRIRYQEHMMTSSLQQRSRNDDDVIMHSCVSICMYLKLDSLFSNSNLTSWCFMCKQPAGGGIVAGSGTLDRLPF